MRCVIESSVQAVEWGEFSPIRAVRALASTMIPLVSPFELARSFASVIATAPTSFHIVIGIAFLVVNVILVLLLRRPPKGYDA